MNNDIEINNSSKVSAGFRLSPNAIRDYKTAYLLEKGILLTDEEAHAKALKLLMLIKPIYKPVPKEVFENA